jgi:hypothetical protein
VLEGEDKSKTREIVTLGTQNETTCKMLKHEIQDLLQTRDQQAQVLSVIFVFFIVSHLLLYLSKEKERSITKLETKFEREKARRHAATTEDGVAVGLLLTAQQQLQAAEAQGQVCKRVRGRVRIRECRLFVCLFHVVCCGVWVERV